MPPLVTLTWSKTAVEGVEVFPYAHPQILNSWISLISWTRVLVTVVEVKSMTGLVLLCPGTSFVQETAADPPSAVSSRRVRTWWICLVGVDM